MNIQQYTEHVFIHRFQLTFFIHTDNKSTYFDPSLRKYRGVIETSVKAVSKPYYDFKVEVK